MSEAATNRPTLPQRARAWAPEALGGGLGLLVAGPLGAAAGATLGAVAHHLYRRATMDVRSIVDRALGIPYVWGAGQPSDPYPRRSGYDCSGFAQGVLVQLGLLPADAPDRSAQGLHDLSAVVVAPVPGDLAFYGPSGSKIQHVAVVTGDGEVAEASVSKGIRQGKPYRSDLVRYGRILS